jgi:hypothetical protein
MKSPVDEALQKAAAQLAQVRFTVLSSPPDDSDVEDMVADIIVIAKIFDSVIYAIGEYAVEYFDLMPHQRSLFHDQVQTALEGRAIHAIEAAHEAEQEDIEAHQEDPRSHSNFEGQD